MKQDNLYNYCHVASCSDVGCVRQANEDSMGIFRTPNGLAVVVCDGMGGHVGGAVASRTAVDAIGEFLNGALYSDARMAIGYAIDRANQAVLEQAKARPELSGMGSTCVLLLVRDGKVYIGHVGDSRIYLIRSHSIRCLTRDDSYVQMLVDMGQITPEEAERHPRKNEITNALGLPDMKPATVKDEPFLPEAGDCFLLCSDGLSGMVSDREIERIVSRQSEMTTQERAELLVQRAKDYGGLDNVTVQLVEFAVTPGSGHTQKKRLPLVLGAVFAALIVVAGALAWMFYEPKTEPIAGNASNPAGEAPRDSARQRSEKLYRFELSEKEFKKGEPAFEIEFWQETTAIRYGKGLEGSTTIGTALPMDSLKHFDCRKQIENGKVTLLFPESIPGDSTVWLTLSDSLTVHRFEGKIKGKAPAAKPKPHSEAGKPDPKAGQGDNGSEIPNLVNGLDNNLTQDGDTTVCQFVYEPGKVFFRIEKKKNGWQFWTNAGDAIYPFIVGSGKTFEIDDTKIDYSDRSLVSHDGNKEKLEFSFKKVSKVPEQFTVSFVGTLKEEGSSSTKKKYIFEFTPKKN